MSNGTLNETLKQEEARYLKNIKTLFAQPDVSRASRIPNNGLNIDMDDYFERLCNNMPAVGKAIRDALGDDVNE